jgi:hypothetical protein
LRGTTAPGCYDNQFYHNAFPLPRLGVDQIESKYATCLINNALNPAIAYNLNALAFCPSDYGLGNVPRLATSGEYPLTPLKHSANPALPEQINNLLIEEPAEGMAKKPGLGDISFMYSSKVRMLVRLHRPLPVIRSLRAGFSIFSSKTTLAPSIDALPAASSPAGPPPITAMSKLILTGTL